MSLEVYPSDFSTRYEISHAISILLSVYYNDIGKMTIVCPINDYNITAMQKDYVVYDTVRKAAYIIANIKIDTDLNRITANGFTAEWLLNKRVVLNKYTMTNVESGAYSLVDSNKRGLTGIRNAPIKGLSETVDSMELYGDQLYDSLSDVFGEVGLGSRMLWDDAKNEFVFEVYKGVDRTSGIYAVIFSEEQGTAQNLIINDDVSSMKNVAYIEVEYDDDTKTVESVGTAEGDERSEIWSIRSVRQGHDETREETVKRAKAEAALELARNIHRLNFSVTVDPEELGEKYNLGDIVGCVSLRFGIQFTARVSGIKYTLDIRGERTEVILGTPSLTAIGGLNIGRN